ncbi:DUF2507 domain-containing protein [Brevibacillus sp. SYSU BS000544]|uniref:DUF2507 domain-containing protein n=1 Tax=Brevibacillus sp. SYSU BS000544 TaxID=3416443 RepID=UPI003CE48848
MRQIVDPLATLFSSQTMAHLEQMNMPYLGFHMLRNCLTQKLLGDSEGPILYWLGKDIGSQISLQSAHDLILPFIRLGLGKLDLLEEREQLYRYSLTHSVFTHMEQERLERSLLLECGIIAGAISHWLQKEANAQLELLTSDKSKHFDVHIIISVGDVLFTNQRL